MNVITSDTDSFYGLAIRYTGSPARGQDIADYNGMQPGTPLDVALEPGLAIEIPDGWLKPGAFEIVGVGVPAITRYWAIAGIIAAILFLTARKPH